MCLRALEPIAAGQEVLICYVDQHLPLCAPPSTHLARNTHPYTPAPHWTSPRPRNPAAYTHTHTHTHTWRLLAVNGLSRGCSDERKATLQVKAVPHLSPAHRRQGDRTGRRSASAYALRGTLPFLALSLPFCQRLTPLLVVLPQEHYGFSCDCGRCKKELRQKLKHRSR